MLPVEQEQETRWAQDFLSGKGPINAMAKEENALIIKKVTRETFDAFLNLIDKLAEFEKLAPPDKEAKRRLRADCLSKKPKYEAYVGLIGEKCVAYVICFFTYSSFLALQTLFLEDIFVLNEYRRQGIGKKMFNHCVELAKRKGCGRIEFMVLKWNKTAQKFYEKRKAKRLEWYFYRLVNDDF
ncbi:MAG TPA: GNAT family N-acetyltransferase [Candidatus Limnocylindrales bacterium]|nr:GNAT family N-acetyltransferase [Candidatus Limnocylindrales bacterium]